MQALATVALALAVIAFVAQLIVFVVQAGASNQQMLQSRELHSELLRLLGEMGERTKGTQQAVSSINERLLEAALGKALGTGGGPGSEARNLATEVASLFEAESNPESETEGPVDPSEVIDEDARRQAHEMLLTFSDADAEAAVGVLEQLSPDAREALRDFGADEVRYAGTRIGVGRSGDRKGGPELYRAGLIGRVGAGKSLYRLTDPGRQVARLLMAEGDPPPGVAARLAPFR